MSWTYRNVVRPFLFAHDSEEIHDRTMNVLGWASRHPLVCEMIESFCGAEQLPTEAFGLFFPNPVGLAAGMDKCASAVPTWEAMGFGFAEIGGVTRYPQPGNPAPRMFRIPADEALVNRMGFNNPGADAMAETLAVWQRMGRWPKHPVGINLGKSKVTPLEEAVSDYAYSFQRLWPYCDFFVVNVSSPNTPNLRALQDKTALGDILRELQSINRSQAEQSRVKSGHVGRGPKPILVKVAPDLSNDALDDIVSLVSPCDLAGIVATNTTLERPRTENPDANRIYAEQGGLSGKPLRQRSTEVIAHLRKQTQGLIPLVGVGGILSVQDAWEKLAAGASLIQVYSGLVYEGPRLAQLLVRGLGRQLACHGLKRVHEATGSGLPYAKLD